MTLSENSAASVVARASRAGLEALLTAAGDAFDADQVAVCAMLHDRPLIEADPGPFAAQPLWEHRGDQQIYPASVCKMVYLAALAAFEADGRLVLNEEDHRATKAMIGTSSNDATTYLLGRLTGAFDGPMLDAAALDLWLNARHQVQSWLETLGLPALDGVHLIHSTYEDSPYGRARQARLVQPGNQLSARACAAMIYEMLRGALPGRDWMAGHLSRDWQRSTEPDPEGDQIAGFLTEGIPTTFRVWSKAGHTSWTRHDVATFSAPDGRSATLAVMTEGTAAAAHIGTLPAFARAFIAEAFGQTTA